MLSSEKTHGFVKDDNYNQSLTKENGNRFTVQEEDQVVSEYLRIKLQFNPTVNIDLENTLLSVPIMSMLYHIWTVKGSSSSKHSTIRMLSCFGPD